MPAEASEQDLRRQAAEYASAESERRVCSAHRLARFARLSLWLGGGCIVLALVLWLVGAFVDGAAALAVLLGVGILMLITGMVVGSLASSTPLVRLADADANTQD